MNKKSRRLVLILVVLLLLALLAVLLVRCRGQRTAIVAGEAPKAAPAGVPTSASPASAALPPESLAPATLQIPGHVTAGASFDVAWTGPDNPGDFITIVRADAPPAHYENRTETRHGSPLALLAPMETGAFEVRYVTARSHAVLGRAPISVDPAKVTLAAPEQVTAGASFAVTWTGPDNAADHITIVPKALPDGQYRNHTATAKGSPLQIIALMDPGPAELRYMSGQDQEVLARRDILIVAAGVTVAGPPQVTAGASFAVTWTGPNNAADYITIVPKTLPDGQYRNHTPTAKGSPLQLTALMEPGPAELRYMSGQDAKVLARRDTSIVAAEVTVAGPPQVTAGASFAVTWTGPNNAGDYITIVPKTLPDGQYRNHTPTTKGAPLQLTALMDPGPAELRYMSGQDQKVLARRDILIVAAEVTLAGPSQVTAGASFAVTWTGPNNAADYITIVPTTLPDGQYRNRSPTTKGSPTPLIAPMDPGPAELRYMSGQEARVLARRDIAIVAAKVTLDAPSRATVATPVTVAWTGPNNANDYLTIVPKTAPDGRYLRRVPTSKGSPVAVEAPGEPGAAEVRYMSGQGDRVLARVDIQLVAAP
ncbi:MAG TPA: hypothetical protein VLT83_06335 [Opitutaceae bacterium]|nr:hypothetical protein [Opitutaceae bacterium]